MTLNYGDDLENKKIIFEENNFQTFEGIQIKLNDSTSSESSKIKNIESNEELLDSVEKEKSNEPINTLKEPIIDTLKRDLNNIKEKIKFVLMPSSSPNYKQLYNCIN